MPVLGKPEYTLYEIDLNDRLGRAVIIRVNNDQECAIGAWIAEESTRTNKARYDAIKLDGTDLYAALQYAKESKERKENTTNVRPKES